MPSLAPISIAEPTAARPSAMALLERETRVHRGTFPIEIDGEFVAEGQYRLHCTTFLLRAEGGIGLFYRQGEGVMLDHPADADPRDIALWLNGTPYAPSRC